MVTACSPLAHLLYLYARRTFTLDLWEFKAETGNFEVAVFNVSVLMESKLMMISTTVFMVKTNYPPIKSMVYVEFCKKIHEPEDNRSLPRKPAFNVQLLFPARRISPG